MSAARRASVVAQAKVNLFLRVLAREASGYHQIETLFCRLALGDDITVRAVARGRSLDCDGPTMPAAGLGPVEENLAWRAAVAFGDAAGWPDGFAIEITKRIPVGGGLGGGSADAGGVLRALNALAKKPLPPTSLLRLAASLGADIPFLTQEQSTLALAWGRGERLLALAPLESRPCLLFVFPFGVVTRDAYQWLAESRAAASVPMVYSVQELSAWRNVEGLAFNEFERVVCAHASPIEATLRALRGTPSAGDFDLILMSGSGATIFALPRREPPPGETGAALPDLYDQAPRIHQTFTAQAVEPVRIDD
ncbi:MAG: 4-(cytidine 5'-diphospho)-2-C-methyl-D-erythritol kinase [Gemmatimonadaceae bacterium]